MLRTRKWPWFGNGGEVQKAESLARWSDKIFARKVAKTQRKRKEKIFFKKPLRNLCDLVPLCDNFLENFLHKYKNFIDNTVEHGA